MYPMFWIRDSVTTNHFMGQTRGRAADADSNTIMMISSQRPDEIGKSAFETFYYREFGLFLLSYYCLSKHVPLYKAIPLCEST